MEQNVVDAEVIDQVLLQGYLDNLNRTVIEKMLNMYVEQSGIYLNDIQLALDDGEQELWQQRVHKMKGAAGSVGLKLVHKHLASIEKSTAATEAKKQYIEQLKQLNEAGIAAFTQWLASV